MGSARSRTKGEAHGRRQKAVAGAARSPARVNEVNNDILRMGWDIIAASLSSRGVESNQIKSGGHRSTVQTKRMEEVTDFTVGSTNGRENERIGQRENKTPRMVPTRPPHIYMVFYCTWSCLKLQV